MASNRVSVMRLSMVSLYAGGCPGVAARVRAQAPQHPPVVPQRVIPLRRFDNLNDPAEISVPHDPAERLRPDSSLGDPLMPVHPRSPLSAGVVEMQALKQVDPDHAVEFLPHRPDTIEVVTDGVQMRRVEAEPHPRPGLVRQRVAQIAQLLEPRPNAVPDPAVPSIHTSRSPGTDCRHAA